IVAGEETPAAEPKLFLIFGSEIRRDDSKLNFTGQPQRGGAFLRDREYRVPIYGNALVFDKASAGEPCLKSEHGVIGVKLESGGGMIMRLGYDLFQEIQRLLSSGQPVENAHFPAIELH